MSELGIEKLHPDFGTRITGIDLAAPLDDRALSAVRRAIDDYSFLCSPDQALNDDSQLGFTRQLGEPEVEHVRFGRDGVVQYLSTIGNIEDDGSQRGNDHEMTKYFTGNNMWHSDSSFREVPMCGRLPVGKRFCDVDASWSGAAMCGRLPVGKRFCDVDASWSGAAMCPAFWCGVHGRWP